MLHSGAKVAPIAVSGGSRSIACVVDFVMRRLAPLVCAGGLLFVGCSQSGDDAEGSNEREPVSGAAGSSGAGGSATSGGRGGASGAGGRGGQATGGAVNAGAGGAVNAGAGGFDAGTGGVNAGFGGEGAGAAGVNAGSGGDGGDAAGAAGTATDGGEGGINGAGSGGTMTDGGAPGLGDCEPGTGFVGQLTGPGSPVPNGGVFTTDPNKVAYGDANLDAVVAAYPEFDAVWEVDVEVDGAVVTATAGATPGPAVSASRTDFWIADDNVLLKVALDPALGPGCCPDFDVRTGMRISFRATEVSLFAGLGQITVASNFVAGEQGSCVLVREPELITQVDFYQIIRISGQLEGEPLAGDDFYNWQLGLSDVIMYDFMSTNPALQAGQTVTFVGPVSPYVGHHMLVERNPDWIRVDADAP
jgi:hypothetical protein